MNLGRISIILICLGILTLAIGWSILSAIFILTSGMIAWLNYGIVLQKNRKDIDYIVGLSLTLTGLFAVITVNYLYGMNSSHVAIILVYLVIFLYFSTRTLILSETERQNLVNSISSDIKVLLGDMYGSLVIISTAGFIFAFSVLKEYQLAVFVFTILLMEIFFYMIVAMPEKKQKTLLNIKIILLLLISLVAISILALYYIGLLEIAMIFLIISSMGYCIYKAYIIRND